MKQLNPRAHIVKEGSRSSYELTDPEYYDQSLDAGYLQYEARYQQPHLHRLHTFLLFGWGKFEGCDVVDDEDYCGEFTPDKKKEIEHLLTENFFHLNPLAMGPEEIPSIDICEGLHWC